jgi:hypothetical protein
LGWINPFNLFKEYVMTVVADPKAIAARRGVGAKPDPKAAQAARIKQEAANRWRKEQGLEKR